MTKRGIFFLFTIEEFMKWFGPRQVIRQIKLIQNHHTWLPGYKEFNNKPDHFYWLESMQDYQVNTNGFSQIAQNLTTFPDGKVALCRPIDTIPAGIKGANQFGICIEHLGNFDLNQDQMTPEHIDTIIKLNAFLCKKFSLPINTESIVYHHWYDLGTGQRTDGKGQVTLKKDGKDFTRDTMVKTCPGTNFFGGNTVEVCEEYFLPLLVKAEI